MEEAEAFYREALEIRRNLAQGNPAAYNPFVAETCFNMALFELQRSNPTASKALFEEALSIYRKYPHLAKDAEETQDILNRYFTSESETNKKKQPFWKRLFGL